MSYVDLTGKVAVVTGASRGIGRAIAKRLAACGASVVCADVDYAAVQETARECDGKASAVELDVASVETVERVISNVLAEHGKIDIVVNNAGINRDAMLHKMTDDQWRQVLDVDLSGVFYMTRAASRPMREAKSGRIINISSASWFGNIGQANYAAAKAGVIGLTRTASKELGRYQVTANAICPGFIDTDMTRGIPSEIWDAQLKKIPLGRAGQPDDVANVVAFLASEEGSYLTGEVINVGGGYAI